VKTILIRNHGRFGCVVHSEKPIVGYPARAHLENQTVETMKQVQANTVNADTTPAHGQAGMPVMDAITCRVSCRAYQPITVCDFGGIGSSTFRLKPIALGRACRCSG